MKGEILLRKLPFANLKADGQTWAYKDILEL